MDFGIFYVLENRFRDHESNYQEMLSQIEYAEGLGFNQVWLAEHHSSSYGTMPRPQIALASVAERTESMKLGPLVSILPFDNPVRIAEDFAMVDVLSGGRLTFGVGRGYQPSEFRNMGADMENSREVFDEALDIILGLWNNETFSYEGEHFTIPEMSIRPTVVQDPHPPVYIASISSSTFDIVVDKGLNCCATAALNPLEETKGQLEEARQELIERGKPAEEINFPFLIQASLSHDPEKRREEIRDNYEWYYHKLATLVPGGEGEDVPESYEEYQQQEQTQQGGSALEDLIQMGAVILDPDTMVEQIKDMKERFDLKSFNTWHRVGGMEDELVRESMEIMAKEVMPEFQEEEAAEEPARV